jgi:TolR protein
MAMSSMDGGGDGAPRPLSEINVTPLVDVMLVLLIIFMVAAPLMMVGVPVQLPKTSAAKVKQPREPLVVSLTRDEQLYLRDTLVPEDQLVARLAELHAVDPEATVYVRGDKSLPYGRVMDVMGQVGRSGFSKVSLLAETAGRAPTGSAGTSR